MDKKQAIFADWQKPGVSADFGDIITQTGVVELRKGGTFHLHGFWLILKPLWPKLIRTNEMEGVRTQHIHPGDLVAVNEAVRRSLAGEDGGVYDMLYRTIGADDGVLRWVHFSGRAYIDAHGKPIRFGGIVQDITGSQRVLRETERNLTDQERLFRNIVEQSPAAIALFMGPDLIVEMANKAFLNIAGRGREIEGQPLSKAMPELNDQPFMRILTGGSAEAFTLNCVYGQARNIDR